MLRPAPELIDSGSRRVPAELTLPTPSIRLSIANWYGLSSPSKPAEMGHKKSPVYTGLRTCWSGGIWESCSGSPKCFSGILTPIGSLWGRLAPTPSIKLSIANWYELSIHLKAQQSAGYAPCSLAVPKTSGEAKSMLRTGTGAYLADFERRVNLEIWRIT